jgi:hypothetical protein
MEPLVTKPTTVFTHYESIHSLKKISYEKHSVIGNGNFTDACIL